MPTVYYSCDRHPYGTRPTARSRQRPWVEVVIHHAGNHVRVFCVADTGADDTMLDTSTAILLGLTPVLLPSRSVTVGNGHTVSYGMSANMSLDFAGGSVTADVLFGPIALPLLGRSAMVMAGLEFGFDGTGWKHT